MQKTEPLRKASIAAEAEIPALTEYTRKRDFKATSEPPGAKPAKARHASAALHFVIQKHDARRLHYDFRLELEGVLKSWAVPKGPSLDPKVKRLAVHVEDHPLDYADFEGSIPAGQYGAGEVIVWDRGEWRSIDADPVAALRVGKLKFWLFGKKLSGGWTLVRTGLAARGDKEQWLLIKDDDPAARYGSDYDVTVEQPQSVLSDRKIAEKVTRGGALSTAVAKREKGDALLGAPRKPLFVQLSPELATLVRKPPSGDWQYEIKFDGYRLLARVDNSRVRLFTRNGLDWTKRLESLAAAVSELGMKSAWLDGEIVVADQNGRPDFQALQNAFDAGRSDAIVYFLFDIPYYDGRDLRGVPLERRRAVLKDVLNENTSPRLRYSEDISAPAADILKQACDMGLEGVIGKRVGSPYVSRRSGDWIKLKCKHRQEFVIGGLTRPQGRREGFGALLLGVNDDSGLRYVGRVGTGFTTATLNTLLETLNPLARHTSPFSKPPRGRDAADVVWLEPRRICEVEFAGWTGDGRIRHASFHGLRDDKAPRSIRRETATPDESSIPAPPPKPPRGERSRASAPQRDVEVAGVSISHPDRVIDQESGTTKRALAEFYRDIAPYLLPQLTGRPLSLVRAPNGVSGEQFFQRHAGTLDIPDMRLHGSESEQLMEIITLRGLVGAIQMGSIEFHTWNANVAHVERPDRVVFDLDPDPSLPWSRIVEATHLLLALLDEIGLQSFLKTSGGKGMHIVVPIARVHDWASVKEFSKRVASHLALVFPQRFADRMGAQNRVGKIYIDYLRNQSGGTTVAAYSVRARPGLGVSVPIARGELDVITSAAAWTVGNLRERFKSRNDDPWADYRSNQRITRAMSERLHQGRAP